MTLVEPSKARPADTHGDGSDWTTVTFVVPASVGCRDADLVAEFLAWVPMPLDRLGDGSFSVTLRLSKGQRWTYRFLLDGDRFINDWDADDYLIEPNGACVSMLHT
jgi:hypothetical protein